MMTALPSRCYSGHCKATQEDDDPGIPGREICKEKYGRQASDRAGGR